jgi:hypothetical protein
MRVDLSRISELLEQDISRLSRLVGENIKMIARANPEDAQSSGFSTSDETASRAKQTVGNNNLRAKGVKGPKAQRKQQTRSNPVDFVVSNRAVQTCAFLQSSDCRLTSSNALRNYNS